MTAPWEETTSEMTALWEETTSEMTAPLEETTSSIILSKYELEEIYNAGQCGLFDQVQPDKSLTLRKKIVLVANTESTANFVLLA